MKYSFLILMSLFLIALSLSIFAKPNIYVQGASCTDEGILNLTLIGRGGFQKVKTNDINVYLGDLEDEKKQLISGIWDDDVLTSNDDIAYFFSNDSVLNRRGNYRLEISFKVYESSDIIPYETGLVTKIECPGFRFSCYYLGTKIDYCYNEDNYFEAVYSIYGLHQQPGELGEDAIKYRIAMENQYEDVYKNIRRIGDLPKDAEVTKIDKDKYKMTINFGKPNFVENFKVTYGLDDINHPLYLDLKGCLGNTETYGDLYSYEICSDRKPDFLEVEEKKIQKEVEEIKEKEPIKTEEEQLVQQIKEIPQVSTKKDYTNIIIISVAIIVGFVILGLFLRKRK